MTKPSAQDCAQFIQDNSAAFSTTIRYGDPMLTIIRGLPGSGKSTCARKLKSLFESAPCGQMAVVCEADAYFEKPDGSYEFDPSKLGAAHTHCQNEARAALRHGVPQVIISNTTTSFKEVKPYLDMAAEFGAGVRVVTMIHSYGSLHDVPAETMVRMQARFVGHVPFVDQCEFYLTYHNHEARG